MGKSGADEMAAATFAVRKDRLGDDEHWRQRRSDTSTFVIDDFDFSSPIPVSSTKQARPFWPNFWRPVRLGVVALVACLIALAFAGDAMMPIQIGDVYFFASLGLIAVVVIFLAYVVYAGVLFGMNPGTKIKPHVFDVWRYVVPGWQPCHFTFGSEGIGVDGTHFLYFFEWADLEQIEKKNDRLVLRNLKEHVLTIPRHFFDRGNGGDISWHEVPKFIEQYKPSRAYWS